MTCDQFKALIQAEPGTLTVAEISAVMRHDRECQACWQWSQAHGQAELDRRGLTREEYAAQAAVAVAMMKAIVASDPEART
jgi:hypothetical protein